MTLFIRVVGMMGATILGVLFLFFGSSGSRESDMTETRRAPSPLAVEQPIGRDSGRALAAVWFKEAREKTASPPPAAASGPVASSGIVSAPGAPLLSESVGPPRPESVKESFAAPDVLLLTSSSSLKNFIGKSEKVEAPVIAVLSSSTEPSVSSSIDEEVILHAVVKIECLRSGGLGKYVGSGFALERGVIVTAGHLVMFSAEPTCSVIFPERQRPIYYLKAAIRNRDDIRKRHDGDGVDFAFLDLPAPENYPDALAIFAEYPAVPYPICRTAGAIGDRLFHFGYPSNFAGNSHLEKTEGELAAFADIEGVGEQLSLDQTHAYRTPQLAFTDDETRPHPYTVSRVASFYGDSGGLALNADRECIIGPHRAATIGGSAGENYALFFTLGWNTAAKNGE